MELHTYFDPARGITLDEVEVVKISLRALEMKEYLNCISKL